MKPVATWGCSRCDREFVGLIDQLPPGWILRGDELRCDDCAPGYVTVSPARPITDHRASLRLAGFDAAIANLVRNGAARDLADPDGARIAA